MAPEGRKKKKEKIPAPGAKGEPSTSFYTRKKWKNVMQYSLLELAGRGINGRGAQIIGNALIKNTYVTKLDLCSNNIGDEGAVLLANVLKPNTHIHWLNLAHNGITDVGGIALASAFIPSVSPSGQPGQWNRTLMTVILMGNEVGDDTLLAFSNAAACHHDLTRVDLSWNRVGPQGTKCLARCFQRSPQCVFVLAANCLGDSGVAHLCEAMEQYGGKGQTTMNLYRNDISHRGAAAIGKLLCTNSSVLDVNLCANTLGAKGVQELRTLLSLNTENISLRTLNLADNMLGDEGAKEVAALIASDLPNLQRIDFSDNLITDVGMVAIADALRANSKLVQAVGKGNTLGPKGVAAVLKLVRETKTLKSLNLSGCVESADHRREITLAVGESDGVHVEMGNQPDGDDDEGDIVGKMTEFLQIQADQEAQKEKEAAEKKKKSRKKSAAA